MQYILTQAEFDKLRAEQKMAAYCSSVERQTLCTLAANHIPANRDWAPDNKTPWGCILNRRDDPSVPINPSYCDCCPVKVLCMYEHKEFSK